MNAFNRLIFLIIGLSVISCLSVVLVANARSGARQQHALDLEQQRFADMIHRLDDHFRRADMVVDWQKVDGDGHVIQTSLLVRQYRVLDSGPAPLPVEHVAIPGDQVHLDGMILTFSSTFNDAFAAARGARIALFDHLFGDGQPPAEQFAFNLHEGVPPAMRVHDDRVTHGEEQFWDYVWWNFPPDEKKGAPDPASRPHDVTFTLLPPATRKVRRGLLYSAFVSRDGVSIDETDDRRRLSEIVSAAQAEAAAQATQPSP